ncbi:MAG: DUF1573 domain-containing protein [Bacteroidales bacterium]|jgi:hypothetical protein|nr:DUF1573 domain-containing protein [Bacteroidales bacterium]
MKKNVLILAVALFIASMNSFAQSAKRETMPKPESLIKVNGPVARFDKTQFEFADLTQGIPGTASFVLTNDGKEPLIIASATASCGCTNLTYSKEPTLPGKSTTISVTYNAAVVGNFIKSVTVRLNTGDQPVTLQIKGKVLPKS